MVLPESEELSGYYMALGEFVSAFSEAEFMVQLLLWQRCKIDYTTSLVFFRGMGLKQQIDAIRAIHKEHQTDIDPVLDEALSQLVVILGVRNDILHFGFHLQEGDEVAYVRNHKRTQDPKKIKEIPISPKILRDMVLDLSKINYRVGLFTDLTLAELDTKTFEEQKKNLSRIPFLYKLPSQEKKSRKNRHTKK